VPKLFVHSLMTLSHNMGRVAIEPVTQPDNYLHFDWQSCCCTVMGNVLFELVTGSKQV